MLGTVKIKSHTYMIKYTLVHTEKSINTHTFVICTRTNTLTPHRMRHYAIMCTHKQHDTTHAKNTQKTIHTFIHTTNNVIKAHANAQNKINPRDHSHTTQ